MDIRIDANAATPIYLQIVEQVRNYLASGRLRPGDELPTIQVLAERLLLNSNTVARAYRELKARGLAVRRSGGRTYASGVGDSLAKDEGRRKTAAAIDEAIRTARQTGISVAEFGRLVRERVRAAEDTNEED
jgi:GntR family transcriptional regulator